MRSKKGQNIIEYILVMTALIILFIVLFSPAGPFKPKLNETLDDSVGILEKMAVDF